MKKIYLLLLFSLIAIKLQGQCDAISMKVWDIIKQEKYERFDALLMSVEQQRKQLHWTKSEAYEKLLIQVRDSLKSELIASAMQLRKALLGNRMVLSKANFVRCHLVGNTLNIVVSDGHKESTFKVETRKIDKRYLVLPINTNPPELPLVRVTEEEMENSTLIIDGESFRRIEPTDNEKAAGLKILEQCMDDFDTFQVRLLYGMKDKNDKVILSYFALKEYQGERYRVYLEGSTCVKD